MRIKTAMAFLALGTLTMGCGTGTQAADTNAETAQESSSAQAVPDAQSARAFVDGIYSQYEGDGLGLDFENPEAVFEPQLAAAFRAEIERAEETGDMPDVGDPFCACNDYTGIEWSIGEVEVDGDMATVAVQTSLFGQTVDRVAMLQAVDGEWRVYDMQVEGYDVSFRRDTLGE